MPFFYPPSSSRSQPASGPSKNIYYDPHRYPDSDDELIISDNEEDEDRPDRTDRPPLPHQPHPHHRRIHAGSTTSSSRRSLNGKRSKPRDTKATHTHHTRGTTSASSSPSFPPPRRLFFTNGASAPLSYSFSSSRPGVNGKMRLWDGSPMMDMDINAGPVQPLMFPSAAGGGLGLEGMGVRLEGIGNSDFARSVREMSPEDIVMSAS